MGIIRAENPERQRAGHGEGAGGSGEVTRTPLGRGRNGATIPIPVIPAEQLPA